ncbi:GIY-YIG nuclease family protein [Synechococcus sp. ROS8604]|uniref:GIY-YIG nuclease family protein n=1 Tax=Synechococcus sp. ROS8604 TaxID=1442557 RepID=UPI00164965B4|nr:GIY-YIG nuclease family protein [Synechococcus sp. ROS8604]QNI89594.1 hypothetical protein SynROS8604_02979 [Synechococcus sp. ROS8604]
MGIPPGQGNLFEQPLAESSGLIDPSLPLTAELLRGWQERIHQFQAPLFAPPLESQSGHRDQPTGQQHLFASDNTNPLSNFQPLQLRPLALSFWRWPNSPHQGAAIYLVMDRPKELDHPILLYIGETKAADRRWKGEHDCKAYLASYQEACMGTGLCCSTSIRFWADVPQDTRSRRRLEQTLIRLWQPPFNKETRARWSTPFHAD